jgi:hypothetical protein
VLLEALLRDRPWSSLLVAWRSALDTRWMSNLFEWEDLL